NDLQLQICDGLIWQVTKMTEDTLDYAQDVGEIPEIVHSLAEINWKNGIEGFMATSDWSGVAEYIDQSLPQVYYVNSEPGCIDIMAQGISKWKGICNLAQQLN